jgi:ATP-binding cassette subfamily F protein 3
LALVILLLDPPNLLLMDEPTTHLDMASIEALITALEQFSGTIIFISHDVYFIRKLSTHVVRVEGGRLTHYPGGYQYYLDKTTAAAAAAVVHQAAQVSAPAKPRDKEQKRLEAEERQARYRKKKTHIDTVSRLEKEIARLEVRQKEISAELEKSETYEKGGQAMQLNREWQENADKLKALGPEWEQAAAKLEEAGV